MHLHVRNLPSGNLHVGADAQGHPRAAEQVAVGFRRLRAVCLNGVFLEDVLFEEPAPAFTKPSESLAG